MFNPLAFASSAVLVGDSSAGTCTCTCPYPGPVTVTVRIEAVELNIQA